MANSVCWKYIEDMYVDTDAAILWVSFFLTALTIAPKRIWF